MRVEWIQPLSTVVLTIVGVLGFVGLIVELRYLGHELRANARGNIFDMGARLKEVFVRHPELRRYFFDPDATISPTAEEYERVLAIADYFALYLEQITTQCRNIAPEHREAWLTFVGTIYHRSAALREHLEDKRTWYSQDLWDVIAAWQPPAVATPPVETSPNAAKANDDGAPGVLPAAGA